MDTTGINYVELDLDRPRKLRYRIPDLRDACRRLGGLTISALLDRLGQLDLDAVLIVVWAGLRHEDKRLTPERVEELVQDQVDKGVSVAALVLQLTEALNLSGIIGRRRDEGDEGNVRTPSKTDPGAGG